MAYDIGPLDGAITLVWIVGVTNAVNLLDNMDGLPAGVSAAAATAIFALAVLGDADAVARRVWQGQVRVLYPFIEEQRVRLLPEVTGNRQAFNRHVSGLGGALFTEHLVTVELAGFTPLAITLTSASFSFGSGRGASSYLATFGPPFCALPRLI